MRLRQRQGMAVAGRALDRQQIEAVVACEDAQLVLASAGSGKTLSLLAKVEYLVSELHLPPPHILAISFTKKTVAELRERCAVKGVEFRTFHALGKSILEAFAPPSAQKFQLLDENATETLATQLIMARCRDDPVFAEKLRRFSPDPVAFRSLFLSFLIHFKDGLFDFPTLAQRIAKLKDATARVRAETFLDLFRPLYGDYRDRLHCLRAYDFSDMINLAVRIVRHAPPSALYYQYILLDEAQDLSKNRFLLVRELLRKNPQCRLFAVGDDWQSIYRFTGSDLGLIDDFSANFERFTRKSFIETTHRFGPPTTGLSSRFVRRNPRQSAKKTRSGDPKKCTPIRIVFNGNNHSAPRNGSAPSGCSTSSDHAVSSDRSAPPDLSGFLRVLDILLQEYGYEALSHKELQVISRYNRDIERLCGPTASSTVSSTAPTTTPLPTASPPTALPIVEADGETIIWHDPRAPARCLRFEFCSMHRSKGITRDIVIVLNMNDSVTGMPATRENDPLVELLLSKSEHFPFAEERRLFYVAITRAREQTFLIADAKTPSPFLFELSEQLSVDFGR